MNITFFAFQNKTVGRGRREEYEEMTAAVDRKER